MNRAGKSSMPPGLLPTLAVAVFAFACSKARAVDVFGAQAPVPPVPVMTDAGHHRACAGTLPDTPLSLLEAVEKMVCNDPEVRQAWAYAKGRAAGVGQKQAAYLPRLNGELSATHRRVRTRPEGGHRSTSDASDERAAGVGLSWLIYDFGGREASLENARQALAAAGGRHQLALQNSFFQAARAVLDAQAAARRLQATELLLAMAQENFDAADARFKGGAASLSDRVQAQTALSQSMLQFRRGQAELEHARGAIALKMGLPADTPLRLASDTATPPDIAFQDDLNQLMVRALRENPALAAARADVLAASAGLGESRAAGRPSIVLTSDVRNTRTGQSSAPWQNGGRRDQSVGVQVRIPIFQGFDNAYRIQEAQAQVSASNAALTQAEQRVSADVWTGYQGLRTEADSLRRTRELVEQSDRALEIVRGRYRAGIGNITELLNAMAVHASAREQHIETQNRWHVARLTLLRGLGALGFWTM